MTVAPFSSGNLGSGPGRRGGLGVDCGGASFATEIHVEAYAGCRADESPRAFVLGTRRVVVKEELDRWLDPQHRYFKVRCDDGGVDILRHDVPSDDWKLILFNAGGGRIPCLSST
ncbi:MAG: hypothetical protein ACM3L9_06195 [Deltaproteobacteria bacterium]